MRETQKDTNRIVTGWERRGGKMGKVGERERGAFNKISCESKDIVSQVVDAGPLCTVLREAE